MTLFSATPEEHQRLDHKRLEQICTRITKAIRMGVVRARVEQFDGEFVVHDVRVLHEIHYLPKSKGLGELMVLGEDIRLQVELLEGWRTPIEVFDETEAPVQETVGVH
jgi:hypothetical protein